ncbi:GDP-mannose 4,6-dehydratase [Svornostia abyssi]|uniref:UDP-glucuronate decarboxylase n=1 Tax=Svornostia abyssi TaxID=2898438 RepID=A0ABY5PM16_9ACTN|nr:GDP-mannose 4,6-dehydratase [Parviterribacteraceae bacterium J379]
MRFLITGGAGFIGSHLSEALLASGHAVRVLDDLSTGRAENVAHLAGRPGFAMTIGSCRDLGTVEELVAEADVICHLAAAVGVEKVVDHPVQTIETNVHGTEVVLAAAVRRRTPLLLASTSEVYGRSPALPFREDGDLVLGAPTRARWSYACSKAIDEFLAFAYAKEFGLPVLVTRLFNTVGPRQTGAYGMVIPRFVGSALRAEPIRVYGDGRQTRCFCHVTDVVAALAALLEGGRFDGVILNVGSTDEVTIGNLARHVIARTGSSSPIVRVPYDEAYGEGFEDLERRVPDISRVSERVGWRPTRTLDDILTDVIAHERERGTPPNHLVRDVALP